MTLDPLLVSAIGTAIAAVIGAGIKKVWVWGWVLADKEKQLAAEAVEKLFWRDVALRSMGHTEKAIALASTAASKPSDG